MGEPENFGDGSGPMVPKAPQRREASPTDLVNTGFTLPSMLRRQMKGVLLGHLNLPQESTCSSTLVWSRLSSRPVTWPCYRTLGNEHLCPGALQRLRPYGAAESLT